MSKQDIIKRMYQLTDALSVVGHASQDIAWDTADGVGVDGLIQEHKKLLEAGFLELEKAVKAIREIPEQS